MQLIVFDLDNTLILTDGPEFDSIRRSLAGKNDITALKDYLSRRGRLVKIPEKCITELHRRFRLGVFSRAPHAYVSFMLKYCYPHTAFDVVVAYEDVGRLFKPHPYGIRKAMSASGITDPNEVLYVGDDMTDRVTAENAGCRFLHWYWTGYYGKIIRHPVCLDELCRI